MRLAQRLRPLRGSIAMAALTAALLSAPYAGFMAYVVVLGLLIWLPVAASRFIRRPETRAHLAAVFGAWVAALLVVAAVQGWRHAVARSHADAIVAEIEHFHAVHHRYPDDLTEIGLSHDGLAARLDLAGYEQEGQVPHFFYAVTYMPFAVWSFDFRTRAWEIQD
ncbi:hypothetical protein [Dyella ginsengisoli]|uniref:hypothetical protein n=1 Tax=Dyella ginsengisoli TaxID=363848 RepID=UPI0003671C3E|nr:hypothetical protein [Dyella ginsengisoli]